VFKKLDVLGYSVPTPSCECAELPSSHKALPADLFSRAQFAIDLLAGTFYSVVAFTLFERVRLRKLDRKHYSEGLTNGWERLWHARRDGENYDAYGERMLRRLAGGDDGDEPNLVGGIALSPSVSGEGTPARSVSPPAYRDGGYTSLPAVDDKEARECDSSSLEDDDGVVDDRPNGRHDLPTRRTASVV
jgi:hypothetical protein